MQYKDHNPSDEIARVNSEIRRLKRQQADNQIREQAYDKALIDYQNKYAEEYRRWSRFWAIISFVLLASLMFGVNYSYDKGHESGYRNGWDERSRLEDAQVPAMPQIVQPNAQ